MVTLNKAATSLLQPSPHVTCDLHVHVHVCNCLYYLHHIKYMYVQLLRQGSARKLCPRTTHFSKRKRRAASGGIRTCDVLRARQTRYQLSHRGSSAGQAKSLNVIQGQRHLFPDKWGNSFQYMYMYMYV